MSGGNRPPVPPTNRPAGGVHRDRAAERTQIEGDKPIATAVEPVDDRPQLGPGLRIEHYELIRELGRGGMGQVFLARDTRLGRRVAMKFLATSSSSVTERFKVEARATARCSHENIIVIHEVEEFQGLPYMVLEYVEGLSLAQLIVDRRMAPGRAVELIAPVVRALVAAHANKIIHRDLKPENIIVTQSGTVKVLDFGIAKLFGPDARIAGFAPESTATGAAAFSAEPTLSSLRAPSPNLAIEMTRRGAIVGTLPYMSPEQLGTDDVDHRSDLWAVGIILFEMLAGKHPLHPITQGKLIGAAAAVDDPMPSIADVVVGVPDRLVAIVERCLAKRKTDRYATATELLSDLELLIPTRTGKSLAGDESPYPGLTAFQEDDANRFFGRSQDIAAMMARLRDHPLVGVIGPSGVGKSSFVRAGVVPALKSSGDAWEVIIIRPGRHPLATLAGTLESLRDTRDSDPMLDPDELVNKLRSEPGTFGTRLRSRARKKRAQILVFVDQHEELYTLVPDPGERRAFTACLAGAADDPSGPLRVAVAMRSDFLDRAAEDRRFVEELMRGLVLLQPPSREGLEEALTQPLAMLGHSFEPGIVEDMLEALSATPGSLPLLQFTAAKLWDRRDRKRRLLSREVYTMMGGVAGALAVHADELFAGLTPPDQRIVRLVFQRLVTPERTRAIVELRDLRDLSSPDVTPAPNGATGTDVERVIGRLVEARLLVIETRGESEGPAVEIVHESLIKSWPALGRWLDENHEDAAFLAQLRGAAKQWDVKGRPEGLLWRGDSMEEARLWRSRFDRELPPREHSFLEAVLAEGTRATRRKRRFVIGAFVALVVIGAVTLVIVNDAKQNARDAEKKAVDEKVKAETNETAARAAEAKAKLAEAAQRKAAEQEKLARIDADTRRKQAEDALAERDEARGQVRVVAKNLRTKNEALARAVKEEQAARKAAADAAKLEKQRLVDKKKKKISTELK